MIALTCDLTFFPDFFENNYIRLIWSLIFYITQNLVIKFLINTFIKRLENFIKKKFCFIKLITYYIRN